MLVFEYLLSTPNALLRDAVFDISLVGVALVGAGVWLVGKKIKSGRDSASFPLPPGPKPLPIAGNIHQLPKQEFHKVYESWAKIYGPIVYFHVFGRRFVVLNDMKVIEDLLVKRSAMYSTRPHLVMAGELVGRDQNSVVFLKYGRRLKEVRRVVDSWVGKSALPAIDSVFLSFNRKCLLAFLEKPDEGLKHIKFAIGSLMLKLTYGIDCEVRNDPYLSMVDKMTRITTEASQAGRWLCDSFPILAKVPPWMPFAGFKRWAIESREYIERAIHAPFEFTRKSVLRGEDTTSWLATMMLDADGNVVSGRIAENLWIAASALYVGSIDTTVSALSTCLMMMTLHPEIQQKAHRELDAIIGEDRLPVSADKEALPYIDKIVKETLRFIAVVPIIPHCTDEEDIYMGYKIPKGTYVMANLWAIYHNPDIYRDPEEFKPERFEDSPGCQAEPDLTHATFGFGRRVCPGNHFSQVALFLYTATILSAFNILPAKNNLGEDELPHVKFLDGHIRMPVTFRFRAVPRSDKKGALIRQAAAVYEVFGTTDT